MPSKYGDTAVLVTALEHRKPLDSVFEGYRYASFAFWPPGDAFLIAPEESQSAPSIRQCYNRNVTQRCLMVPGHNVLREKVLEKLKCSRCHRCLFSILSSLRARTVCRELKGPMD